MCRPIGVQNGGPHLGSIAHMGAPLMGKGTQAAHYAPAGLAADASALVTLTGEAGVVGAPEGPLNVLEGPLNVLAPTGAQALSPGGPV